jgi:hypothetical protein
MSERAFYWAVLGAGSVYVGYVLYRVWKLWRWKP